MVAPLAQMRAQVDDVIDDWAVACAVSRFAPGTTDGAGHLTAGTFTQIAASELVWLQPVGGTSRVREAGLDAETTHLAFQKWGGVALSPKDRLLPSGQSIAYDVIKVFVHESHRMAEVKLVLKG